MDQVNKQARSDYQLAKEMIIPAVKLKSCRTLFSSKYFESFYLGASGFSGQHDTGGTRWISLCIVSNYALLNKILNSNSQYSSTTLIAKQHLTARTENYGKHGSPQIIVTYF